MPGAVAGKAELVLAVRAGCLVDVFFLLLGFGFGLVFTATMFDGEVDATLRVETGNVGWVSSEEMLGNCRIPTVGGQYQLWRLHHDRYLRLEESL